MKKANRQQKEMHLAIGISTGSKSIKTRKILFGWLPCVLYRFTLKWLYLYAFIWQILNPVALRFFFSNISHFYFNYRLLQLCQRTMALPVGRGMFTLFSYHPVPTEPLPIPKLNLTGMLRCGLCEEVQMIQYQQKWNSSKLFWVNI